MPSFECRSRNSSFSRAYFLVRIMINKENLELFKMTQYQFLKTFNLILSELRFERELDQLNDDQIRILTEMIHLKECIKNIPLFLKENYKVI